MLKTQGRDILNEKNERIILRGMNLGNWMLIEPNMFGTAGTQRRLKRAMVTCAGREKTDYFFNCLLDKWITDKDICYLKSLGMNSLRVPLDYRYFENDDSPFEYEAEGFKRLDRLVDLCRGHEMYLVLDVHAAQGCQSGDWHCNNVFQEQTEFYYDRTAQNRFTAFWMELVKRYHKEPWIGGYDLLNEPVAETDYEWEVLNDIYIRTIKAIRGIDKEHIIFLEGNRWSQCFEDLKHEEFGDNIVYSPHYYCEAAVQDWNYPGNYGGIEYGRANMEHEMDKRDRWIIEKNTPCWIGEFGVRRLGNLEGKKQALSDYLSVFENRGHSWCYWNFKDLKVRGPLYIAEDSIWRKFVEEFEVVKRKYCTDRSLPLNGKWTVDAVFEDYEEGDFPVGKETVQELLIRNMRETLGDQLTWTFAERFARLTIEEIGQMTDSFLFENCGHYEPMENVIRTVSVFL